MTNVKDKRATTHRLVNKVVCFDCGEATGSAMLVYRQMGPVGDTYEGVAYVHRTNTGCHKGWTATEIRDPSRKITPKEANEMTTQTLREVSFTFDGERNRALVTPAGRDSVTTVRASLPRCAWSASPAGARRGRGP